MLSVCIWRHDPYFLQVIVRFLMIFTVALSIAGEASEFGSVNLEIYGWEYDLRWFEDSRELRFVDASCIAVLLLIGNWLGVIRNWAFAHQRVAERIECEEWKLRMRAGPYGVLTFRDGADKCRLFNENVKTILAETNHARHDITGALKVGSQQCLLVFRFVLRVLFFLDWNPDIDELFNDAEAKKLDEREMGKWIFLFKVSTDARSANLLRRGGYSSCSRVSIWLLERLNCNACVVTGREDEEAQYRREQVEYHKLADYDKTHRLKDALSHVLSPEVYIRSRIKPQVETWRYTSTRLARWLRMYQVFEVSFSLTASIFAALDLIIWLPVVSLVIY